MLKFTLPFLFYVCALNATPPLNWSNPVTIPAVPTVTVYSNAVFGAYDTTLEQLVAVWTVSNIAGVFPYYSTFTPSSAWANPVTFGNGATQPFGDVFPLYLPSGPNAGKIIAAFSDEANNGAPTAYYYNGSWNTSPQVINGSSATTGDVFLAFSPGNEALYAAWTDTSNYPTFALYDNNNSSWVSIASIPTTPTASTDVFITCDGQGNLFAAWTDTSNIPTYAIYNGTSWTNPLPIPGGSTSQSRIFLTYNSSTSQIFAAWNNTSRVFNYAIYENGAWDMSVPVSGTDVQSDVFLTYNSQLAQVFASWGDKANGNPTYAIYDPTTQLWDVAPITTSYEADPEVNLVYAPNLNTMFAFWKDSQSSYPYSSGLLQLGTPDPISNLTGRKLVDDFGTESEIFAPLRWSPSPTTPILGYHVYRDGVLIATLDPSMVTYAAHHLIRGPVTFTVTAFNSNGDSNPISITLR